MAKQAEAALLALSPSQVDDAVDAVGLRIHLGQRSVWRSEPDGVVRLRDERHVPPAEIARQLRYAVGAIRQQSASAGVTGHTGPSPTVIEGLLASGVTGKTVVVASIRGSQRVDDAVGKC